MKHLIVGVEKKFFEAHHHSASPETIDDSFSLFGAGNVMIPSQMFVYMLDAHVAYRTFVTRRWFASGHPGNSITINYTNF